MGRGVYPWVVVGREGVGMCACAWVGKRVRLDGGGGGHGGGMVVVQVLDRIADQGQQVSVSLVLSLCWWCSLGLVFWPGRSKPVQFNQLNWLTMSTTGGSRPPSYIL